MMKAVLVELPSGSRIFLKNDTTAIGRSPDNDVVAGGEFVSRRHCAIVKRGGSFFLEDLGSLNGTYVNGVRIDALVRLRHNDTISLGRTAHAFLFRRTSMVITRAGKFLRKPIHLLFLAAACVVMFGAASYFVLSRTSDRVNAAEGLRRLRTVHGRTAFPDDPAFLAAVEKRIELVRRDDAYAHGLERRKLYSNFIEDVLRRNGLPADYSFIAWAESQYEPKARHARSGAAGMWQLLPSTARAYGLRVDRLVDERFDPVRATEAAAKYLKDLVSMFGKDSFLLTLAAYNAGDAAVLYALKQIDDPVKDRTFWYLYTHDLIPPETKEYVLRIIALIIAADAR